MKRKRVFEVKRKEPIDWRKTFENARPVRCYSLAPVTTASLLTFSPIMKAGLLIIVGAGVFAIGCAYLERYLAKNDDPLADTLSFITRCGLIAGFIVGFGYLILQNPIWRLF